MSRKSTVKFDLNVLDGIRDNLKSGTYVKVGVLGGDKASRKGESITNPELAVIHELGSHDKNIPARSFLRMPLNLKRKNIVEFANSGKVKKLIASGNIYEALEIIGFYCEDLIQSAFATRGYGKWEPIKQATARRKGSTAILIETAELRKSVTSEVITP